MVVASKHFFFIAITGNYNEMNNTCNANITFNTNREWPIIKYYNGMLKRKKK